jgi:hypothetical protein
MICRIINLEVRAKIVVLDLMEEREERERDPMGIIRCTRINMVELKIPLSTFPTTSYSSFTVAFPALIQTCPLKFYTSEWA